AHSYIPPGMVRQLIGNALTRLQANVIANCEFVAAEWRPFVPSERIAVVYNGVSGVPEQNFRRQDGPVIACIGRIAPEKGQLEFVQAAQVIHRAVPEARFQIIGAPLFSDAAAVRYSESVRAAAGGLPVEFPGWAEDIPRALAGIDLLLVPSQAHEATT